MTPTQVARWIYNFLNFPTMPEPEYEIPDQLKERYLMMVDTLLLEEVDVQTIQKRMRVKNDGQ